MKAYEQATKRYVRIVDAMVEALTVYGPLSHEAIFSFVDAFLARDGVDPLESSDFEPALTVALGLADGFPGRIFMDEARELYKLRSDPYAAQRVPAPKDFVQGFYRLYERYEALLERHPEDRLPDEVMDSLFGRL